ncbi:hypothetical protein GCM10010402_10980 [Actinomadura luteofluorescens]
MTVWPAEAVSYRSSVDGPDAALGAAFAGAASVGAAATAIAAANEARTETLNRLLAERFILSPGVFGLAVHLWRAPERLVNPGAPSSGDASTPRGRMRPIRK